MDLLVTSWTDLALVNYAVAADGLAPFVPAGTVLDTWDGRAYVSVVGFVWTAPRLWGLPPPPFHDRFAELNLRTYVRRTDERGAVQRGVVFLAELVGSPLVAWVGRDLYHENFALARVEAVIGQQEVAYHWHQAGAWAGLSLIAAEGLPAPAPPPDFFLDRDHAFTRRRDGGTMGYAVTRESGEVRACVAHLAGDPAGSFGEPFREALSREPASAFWAAGSTVRVARGERLR